MMQNAIKMVLERVGTSSPFGEETPEALRIGEEVLGTQHLFDVKELGRGTSRRQGSEVLRILFTDLLYYSTQKRDRKDKLDELSRWKKEKIKAYNLLVNYAAQ